MGIYLKDGIEILEILINHPRTSSKTILSYLNNTKWNCKNLCASLNSFCKTGILSRYKQKVYRYSLTIKGRKLFEELVIINNKKRCRKCGKKKSIDCFSNDKYVISGKSFACTTCCKTKSRESSKRFRENNPDYGLKWRKRNKEKLKEKRKEYYQNLSEAQKEARRAYRRSRKEQNRKAHAEYIAKNPEKWKKYDKERWARLRAEGYFENEENRQRQRKNEINWRKRNPEKTLEMGQKRRDNLSDTYVANCKRASAWLYSM